MIKRSTIFFIVCLAILFLTQYKLVLPLVYDVIKSDLFLVESKDEGGQKPISTALTAIAYTHCNNYIKSDLAPNEKIVFSQKPQNVWSLGNYQFIVSAEAQFVTDPAHASNKKYVCRITYNNGDNEEGASDFKNWSIIGITGIS